MKNLSIDTSSKICSCALLENDKLIDEIYLDDGKTHSEKMMPLVDELLKKNKIDISQVDLISVCSGPGSFTGIRIGISTIKAISEILQIPIASVTSLETLAKNCKDAEVETIVSLIDARNDQVYCGIFDKNINQKEEYIVDDINEVINHLEKYENIVCIGDGAVLHKEKIINKISDAKFIEENRQFASNVGKIGYLKFLNKDIKSADDIMPVYMRKSQAERLKK